MREPQVPWERDFYDPALYDAGAGDSGSNATVEYYRTQLAGAPRYVADIGCGTGRIALQLAGDGHRILGVDVSLAMLARLQSKAERLPREQRARFDWRQGSFLDMEAPEASAFDALIAPDDFVPHLDPQELERFFLRAHGWLRPGGALLTDTRERSAARLQAAAAGFPKPMLTYGLADGVETQDGVRHAAMMGWEEYDADSRRLVSHQLFSYIRPDGAEERRVWKTVCQYNHTNAALIGAAQRAGFALEAARGREPGAEPGEQGGFFRFVREQDT
ncbi:class I SAM-dependent methyltransferase [Trinickia terrae]|uniref:Class I SAM-dependent methyltransferase n=1 Tax=Trinickia terrae TaxID=2571161 RepID=A0A4U1I272_9BURK|nr:class I SAM-dependent methyltransferase [Trinickia terrae]TKC87277.1 class I SAM-dependent methyltransferase [Trinickia terrae]